MSGWQEPTTLTVTGSKSNCALEEATQAGPRSLAAEKPVAASQEAAQPQSREADSQPVARRKLGSSAPHDGELQLCP